MNQTPKSAAPEFVLGLYVCATRQLTPKTFLAIKAAPPAALRERECKGCLGTTCKECHGTEQFKRRTWGTLRVVLPCERANASSLDRGELEGYRVRDPGHPSSSLVATQTRFPPFPRFPAGSPRFPVPRRDGAPASSVRGF
jgi:hypothetical protein